MEYNLKFKIVEIFVYIKSSHNLDLLSGEGHIVSNVSIIKKCVIFNLKIQPNWELNLNLQLDYNALMQC